VPVDVSFLDALVLGASVLEPDLDLRVAESERLRQLTAARPGHVLDALVLDLELQRLLRTERRPLTSRDRLMLLLLLMLVVMMMMMMMIRVSFFSCHSINHLQ